MSKRIPKDHEFIGKRVVLDIDVEIEGYNLVFSDNDLYRVKYWDGEDLLQYFDEKKFKKLIVDNKNKKIHKTFEIPNFSVFSLYKLSSLKVALLNLDKNPK